MARDTGPQCKQCRREGQKLFLKGERCLTEKCGVERRSYPPGEHGRGRVRALPAGRSGARRRTSSVRQRSPFRNSFCPCAAALLALWSL